MSFGDLITLLLFIVFVVAPAFNRSRRANAPRGRPERAPAPERPADDDAARRLEEAVERVRRAMEAEAGGPSSAGSGRSGSDAAAPAPLLSPAAPAATSERPLATSPARPPVTAPARPLVSTPARPPVSAPARPLVSAPARPLVSTSPRTPLGSAPTPSAPEPSSRDLRREAPALAVERRGEGATGWRLDPKSVRDGFIWHHILGRPRAHERLGGTPYRHP